MTTPHATTEPSAALRRMAGLFWEMHVALIKEGFTEQQALVIIGNAMRALIQGNQGGDT